MQTDRALANQAMLLQSWLGLLWLLKINFAFSQDDLKSFSVFSQDTEVIFGMCVAVNHFCCRLVQDICDKHVVLSCSLHQRKVLFQDIYN